MNQNQLQVIRWWHSGRDYKTGISLFSNFCKNKILAMSISKKSEKYGRAKLEYELPKAVHLNYLDMPESDPSSASEEEEFSGLVSLPASPKTKPKDDPTSYPGVIKRLKHEYSEMYNARSFAHKKLLAVPEINNPENNKIRACIIDEMQKLSGRMEMFHSHILAYETDKTIPNTELIWPVDKKIKEPIPLNEESLIAERKRLRILIHYDNNRLKYSVKDKQKEPNPLPPGEKRNKILKQIKANKKEMEKIENLIHTLQTNADKIN
jgi:hypothetical protein